MSIFDILKKNAGDKIQHAPEFIICGLGNPGTRYENTRHNAGFMAVDKLAGEKIKRLKFKSLTGEMEINGVKCFLMKPTTFMNKSGEALREAMAFYKLPPERVIIIFDDISLDVGIIRIRKNGSDGGHNGMKNIIYLTGQDKFPRIKIGVGNKPHPGYDLADWVTGPFKKEEGQALEKSLEKAAGAAELMVAGKFEEAMNKFNGKV